MLIFKEDLLRLLQTRQFSQVHFWADYYEVLLVLTLLTSLVFLFRQQAINYKRIVIPSIIGELSLKFFLPVCIVISVYYGMSLETFQLLVHAVFDRALLFF